jgi:hypothetical protein
VQQNEGIPSWRRFSELLNLRSGPSIRSNLLGELMACKRTSFVTEYQDWFEALLPCVGTFDGGTVGVGLHRRATTAVQPRHQDPHPSVSQCAAAVAPPSAPPRNQQQGLLAAPPPCRSTGSATCRDCYNNHRHRLTVEGRPRQASVDVQDGRMSSARLLLQLQRKVQAWSQLGMKTVRIFSDRIRDRIHLEGF